jgi:predicted transcriptional regulator
MCIIKLAQFTNHPQHMVRYSLRILEQDGLIEPSPQGAITTEAVNETILSLKKSLNDISKIASKLIDTLS